MKKTEELALAWHVTVAFPCFYRLTKQVAKRLGVELPNAGLL